MRHPAVQQILRWFDDQHLPPHLLVVSRDFRELAYTLVDFHELGGPELTVALRKLLEAKDAAVRAAVEAHEAKAANPVLRAVA